MIKNKIKRCNKLPACQNHLGYHFDLAQVTTIIFKQKEEINKLQTRTDKNLMPDYTSKVQNASHSRSKYGVFRSIVLAFSNKKNIYSIYGQKAKSTNAISKLGFSRMQ